jgi:uncharacterized protein (TIGR02145 family)
MTVLITLSTAGTSTGPFDLYTSINGINFTLLVSGIQRSVLVGQGYSSSAVPNGTTKIRVTSTSVSCPNSIDLTVVTSTTTSTTTTSTTTSTTTTTSDPFSYLCTEGDEIQIGGQIWAGCNLNVDRFPDGNLINQVTDQYTWSTTSQPAWCYYNNDPTTARTYGKLYNWLVLAAGTMSPNYSEIAPAGWHVPTYQDWMTLHDYLGGQSVAGGKMKANSVLWSPNTGTNTSGFTALPGGLRESGNTAFDTFENLGQETYFWAQTPYPSWTGNIYGVKLSATGAQFTLGNYPQNAGFSVRLIKDYAPCFFAVAAEILPPLPEEPLYE